MLVGSCIVKLHLFETHSLKEKRHILKSLLGRLQSRFNISVAEVDLFDIWQSSIIGFSCVSNERAHIESVINNVISFIDRDGRVEIIEKEMEVS